MSDAERPRRRSIEKAKLIEAAKRGYWPFEAAAFKPLVELLRSL